MALPKAEQARRKRAQKQAEAEAAKETATADASARQPEDASEPEAPQDEYDGEWDGAEDVGEGPAEASPPPAPATETIPEDAPQVPSGSDEPDGDEDSGEERTDPDDEPLPKEYVMLNGPASFGPIVVGGKRITALRSKLYLVPDPCERADILGTGRFRSATRKDLLRASAPSAGKGGAITRDMLPPGALKGGPTRP